jgi:hypothetical protein
VRVDPATVALVGRKFDVIHPKPEQAETH